ncbi:hypothetical protein BFW01_g11780 [Lasiodiplodia theobromae]|uniref:Secreted protein n=1 Tax=Lasiodiplodia hormozganensis TaxID=869390 RepID=A0AA39WGB8_9PEZI|nr:uncharacterized protein LTHEOB_10533 [Lasiodiplodia theobromae]KAF4539141.1 hypothetical protein LTHEOB_10533 [Lasiodiplodia theobromae]KAF9639974.1 hypothetical protein BFW01_g11780 [Lasiodiplodia theobromae]KAK0614835.1 hypothetical protein DIS24_g11887 [Lasiodiplodia hormozganensis]
MKFSTGFLTIALLNAGAVLADMHNFCGCGHRTGRNAVQDAYWTFNEEATKYACTRYRNRNTGNKKWDKCPDCQMDTQHFDGQANVPACFSVAWHMGGDEFDYYCGLKGLQGYCKDIS